MKLLMKYEEAKKLIPTEFKRLCGVYPETFELTFGDSKSLSKAEKSFGKTKQT